MKTQLISLTLGLSLSASCVSAQGLQGRWSAGLFAFGDFSAYRGVDTDLNILPYLAYDSATLHFAVDDGFAYSFWSNNRGLDVALIASPRWDTVMREGAIFDGLDRDFALEAGARARISTGTVFAEAQFLHDISGVHQGYELDASIGFAYQINRIGIEMRAGARYRDGNLNHYLFGVSAGEATGDRPSYNPLGSYSGYIGIDASYALAERVTLVGSLSYETLGDMTDSPLIDQDYAAGMGVGIVYSF